MNEGSEKSLLPNPDGIAPASGGTTKPDLTWKELLAHLVLLLVGSWIRAGINIVEDRFWYFSQTAISGAGAGAAMGTLVAFLLVAAAPTALLYLLSKDKVHFRVRFVILVTAWICLAISFYPVLRLVNNLSRSVGRWRVPYERFA